MLSEIEMRKELSKKLPDLDIDKLNIFELQFYLNLLELMNNENPDDNLKKCIDEDFNKYLI